VKFAQAGRLNAISDCSSILDLFLKKDGFVCNAGQTGKKQSKQRNIVQLKHKFG